MATGNGLFDVQAAELDQKATDITNVYNEYEQTMSQIRGLVHGLEGIWKGRSMETLVQRFDSEQPSINELGRTIQDYAREAHNAANEARRRNDNLVNKIRQLLMCFFK